MTECFLGASILYNRLVASSGCQIKSKKRGECKKAPHGVQHLRCGAASSSLATLVRKFPRVLPRDILAHIARIIRLSVLLDVNENGVSFIASECAAVEPILSFHGRARNSGTRDESLVQRTVGRCHLKSRYLPSRYLQYPETIDWSF